MNRTPQPRDSRQLPWVTLLALLVSVSLALMLATRDLDPPWNAIHQSQASSASSHAPWQRLESDALVWSPPSTQPHISLNPELRRLLPDDLMVHEVLLDDRLHNRPPPSC